MKTSDFLAQHPVFTTEDIRDFQQARGSHSQWTRKALLAHYQKQQRIIRIRRGVYAAVPPGGGGEGTTPDDLAVDPYLVASKLAPDAVLGYHTALAAHGRAHSASQRFEFLTSTGGRGIRFQEWRFQPVLFAHVLRRKKKTTWGVQQLERSGQALAVTALERTLVDVLERPDLGGGWEEIWRSLESVEFFNLDQIIEYALLLENATTIAKVGFYLEQHRETLMVEEAHLAALRPHRPANPHYLERGKKADVKFISGWNLVVPLAVAERSWEIVL
ncbi:MAG: type IV toxin-antitoxin system AbiEi family antitoxin [Phycisphaerae bacterium]